MPLRVVDGGMYSRAVGYVLGGDDHGLLADVAADAETPELFTYHYDRVRRAFKHLRSDRSPEMARRLG